MSDEIKAGILEVELREVSHQITNINNRFAPIEQGLTALGTQIQALKADVTTLTIQNTAQNQHQNSNNQMKEWLIRTVIGVIALVGGGGGISMLKGDGGNDTKELIQALQSIVTQPVKPVQP